MPEVHEVKFKARMDGPSSVFKISKDGEDRFVIWGKASVEVVDKEGDKITASALKEALPQLLRRKRLSVEHTDQLVGDILKSFETEEPVTVEIDGKQYTRTEFPTDVLQLEDEEPALYVAGEIWNDSRQAKSVREDIEAGVIDSYSISGEAISSSTKVKDGGIYDEISDMDLSAVTLCEEGMNQKAKFGQVVKIGHDDPVSPKESGRASSPTVAVVKTDSKQEYMSNDSEKSDDGEGSLTKEELRNEFKAAADTALADADFVTADEVKSIVDSRIEAEDSDSSSDDEEQGPSNASEEAADEGDVPDDDAEEKADSPDDSDEEDEPDMEPDDDSDDSDDTDSTEKGHSVLDNPDVQNAVETIANAAGGPAPDDDLDEESDVDAVEEPDVDPGDDAGSDVIDQLQELGVPDDLVDAVGEYVEGDDMASPDDQEVEMSEKDGGEETTEKEDAVTGEDLAKAVDDSTYLDMTASGAIPATGDAVEKSFEGDDDEVDPSPGSLDAFYESVGEGV